MADPARHAALAGARVLLTGAAGFIGAACAEALLAAGAEVSGCDSLNDYYDPALKQARLARLAAQPGFAFRRLDLADPHACWAVRRRTFIGSREVVHGAWRNDRVLRLFNRTTAGFKPLPVHEEVEAGRQPTLLPGSMFHYSYTGAGDVLARAVR